MTRLLLLNPNPAPVAERIRARFPDLELTACGSYEEAAVAVTRERPECVLAFKVGTQGVFPRQAILDTDSVKWIQASGAGIDHWRPWDPGRVTLTNASGIHGDVMSQYVLWAILNHQLGFPRLARQQAEREWSKRLLVSAAGLTLVVLGFGRIGQEVGRVARAIGMKVIGVRRQPSPSPVADAVVGVDRMHEVLGDADYVHCVLPLTSETQGLIGSQTFAAMKRGAYFINTGRGKIVDENALRAALESGQLAGATIDVFATEPLPADNPLWRMDNVIVTPHASGDALDWHMRVAELFCDNLARRLAGKPLENVVDPGRGY